MKLKSGISCKSERLTDCIVKATVINQESSSDQDGLPEVNADLWAHHHRLQVHGLSAGACEEGGQLRQQRPGATQARTTQIWQTSECTQIVKPWPQTLSP